MSLLERLPAELRDRIWSLVLGDKVIHMKFAPSRFDRSLSYTVDHTGRFHYLICDIEMRCDTSTSNSGLENAKSPKTFGQRHSQCYNQYPELQLQTSSLHSRQSFPGIAMYKRILSDFHPTKDRTHLSLLRVSRQIHSEATSILYSTNIWSFTHALAFYQFMSSRNSFQKSCMTKIHLDLSPKNCWVRGFWAVEWEVALPQIALDEFKALRILHLDIVDIQEWNGFREFGETLIPAAELKQLGRLPLSDVVVRCTPEEDNSIAAEIRRTLLEVSLTGEVEAGGGVKV